MLGIVYCLEEHRVTYDVSGVRFKILWNTHHNQMITVQRNKNILMSVYFISPVTIDLENKTLKINVVRLYTDSQLSEDVSRANVVYI